MDAVTCRLRLSWALIVLTSIVLVPGCRDGLEDYVSEEGKFRVRMPGVPSLALPDELPKGKFKVSLEQRAGNYTVAWEDLPVKEGVSADDHLEAACKGGVERLQGKALTQKPIALGKGHPGREMLVEWPTGMGIVRLRMYLV